MNDKIITLNKLNNELNSIIDEVNKSNKILTEEIKVKKEISFKKFKDDLSPFMQIAKEIGFKFRIRTGIDRIEIHLVPTQGIGIADYMSESGYYLYTYINEGFTLEELREKFSTNTTRIQGLDLLCKLMANWDIAYKNIENIFIKQYEDYIIKKCNNIKDKHKSLLNELEKYS